MRRTLFAASSSFNDAAATAHNILSHEAQYRLAFVVELLQLYIIVTFILCYLLKPVDRSVSFLAAVLSFIGCTISTVSSLLHLAPLVVLKDATSAFSTDQLQWVALLFLRLGTQASNIMMVFLAFYCMLIGYLIFRSVFLPRIIGAFLVIAGLCYLTNYFASFLACPSGRYPCRRFPDPVAFGDGRKHSAMEGAGERVCINRRELS